MMNCGWVVGVGDECSLSEWRTCLDFLEYLQILLADILEGHPELSHVRKKFGDRIES